MTFTVPESLSEEVATKIAWRIITGEFKSGERIQELRITRELGVSRSSVREALRILERWHVIDLIPHRGAVVSTLSAEQVASLNDTWATLLLMLAIKVAHQWQEKDLEPLMQASTQLRQHVQQNNLVGIVDELFNIIKIASMIIHNEFIKQIMDNLRPAMIRVYYLIARCYTEEPVNTCELIMKILLAVQQRDAAEVKQLIKGYVEHYQPRSLEALKLHQ